MNLSNYISGEKVNDFRYQLGRNLCCMIVLERLFLMLGE